MDVTHNSGGGIDECTASLGTFNNTVTTGTLAIQNNTTGHFGFTLQNIVGTSVSSLRFYRERNRGRKNRSCSRICG
jgi:hypothetical protein